MFSTPAVIPRRHCQAKRNSAINIEIGSRSAKAGIGRSPNPPISPRQPTKNWPSQSQTPKDLSGFINPPFRDSYNENKTLKEHSVDESSFQFFIFNRQILVLNLPSPYSSRLLPIRVVVGDLPCNNLPHPCTMKTQTNRASWRTTQLCHSQMETVMAYESIRRLQSWRESQRGVYRLEWLPTA